MIIAKYQCKECLHEWETKVEGGVIKQGEELPYRHSGACPNCGSLYFQWTNFQELKDKKEI